MVDCIATDGDDEDEALLEELVVGIPTEVGHAVIDPADGDGRPARSRRPSVSLRRRGEVGARGVRA